MPELSPRLAWRRALGGLVALLLAATAAAAQDRPRVAAVNYALSYFAERLGGEEVEVLFPVPAGADPAFWRPGVADISAIQRADLIVLNGAGFAAWTTKASLPRARIVDTSRGFEARLIGTRSVTHSHGADGEHSHAGSASFTWLDPELAILQAVAIAAALEARGLAPAAEVAARLTALTQDLRALGAAAARLRPLAEGQVLIATHPRYQYLARAAGIEIRSVEWDAGAAPDAAQIGELAALAAETGAKALLWEAEPPEAARAEVRGLGLAEMVFPTLATRPEAGDYGTRFAAALDELAAMLTTLDRQP